MFHIRIVRWPDAGVERIYISDESDHLLVRSADRAAAARWLCAHGFCRRSARKALRDARRKACYAMAGPPPDFSRAPV